MSACLTPGFVHAGDAQICFRRIMEAMSRPGSIRPLSIDLVPPAPLSCASAAVLLTLADGSVMVNLSDTATAAREWLVFHTGTRLGPSSDADFIVASARPDFATLRMGTDEAPEAGATLILDLPDFCSGPRYRLTGPGIETETIVQAPLDAGFITAWRDNDARAPRGIDLLLCAGDRIIGLPRSVIIDRV
ncbi:phosphonate C-P lyase system protein PhnH [Acidiphilium sp.]|uniref:phosphonate C-P lyase system protein PhnH n=1 Tax=Acidiphilium sp. TaxID=527 RepID=UPI003CFCC1F3